MTHDTIPFHPCAGTNAKPVQLEPPKEVEGDQVLMFERKDVVSFKREKPRRKPKP